MFIHWSLCKPCLICWFNWQIWSGASHRAYLHISLCRHLSVSIQSRNSSVKIEAREWLFVYMFIQFWIIANIPSRGLSLWLKYLKKRNKSLEIHYLPNSNINWKYENLWEQFLQKLSFQHTVTSSFRIFPIICWFNNSGPSQQICTLPPSGHLFKTGLIQRLKDPHFWNRKWENMTAFHILKNIGKTQSCFLFFLIFSSTSLSRWNRIIQMNWWQ